MALYSKIVPNKSGARYLLYGVLLLGAVVPSVRAGIVTVDAMQDNTLYEDVLGSFSNGAGDHFFSGRTNGAGIRRGMIKFDLSAVPPGSVINSVTMTLFMSRSQSGSQTINLHRVLADWGEANSDAFGGEGAGAQAEIGDVTWVHRFFDTVNWNNMGGDFVGTVSASQSVSGIGTYSWSSAGMASDVQGWVNVPSSHFGWMLRGNEIVQATTKRFDTRENPNPSLRPSLTINFEPGGPIGGCCFEDGDCSVLNSAGCALSGGTYEGDDTSCSPNPCPQPSGACCFSNGDCQIVSPIDCESGSGSYQGNNSLCTPDPCGALPGACCFVDSTCAVLSLDDCASGGGNFQGFDSACDPDLCPLVLTPFIDPLPIPPVAQPTSGSPGGAASYQIFISEFEQQLHSELPPTTLWGYGDATSGPRFPGPTLETSSDQLITVEWINDLRDSEGALRTDHLLDVDPCPHGAEDVAKTVVHLHGGHTPADSDGHPEDTFLPGSFDTYTYPNKQLPATLWYHDHALGSTRLNVYLGLAGFYLIRDQFELDLDLPEGEFEIPLVIQDRTFNSDGSLRYPAMWMDHFFGNKILVNGMVWPFLEVKQGKYRFRLLNGSNSRTYTLALSDASTFDLIGTDAGLLPAPVTMSSITLMPSERADIVIDFESYAPGTEILLTDSAPSPFPGEPGIGVVPDVMKFAVVAGTGHTAPTPAALRPFEQIPESEAVISRDFELRNMVDACTGNVWLINGLHWHDITEFPMLGTAEIWRFINPTEISHPMHIHLVAFQVLDIQEFELVNDEVQLIGSPQLPPPHLAGWKDTIEVEPNHIVRVIARFEDYLGLFAYHCHIIEHEDHEMMRQFRTVECFTNSDCSDGQFCNGNEVCDMETFTCGPGFIPDCSDLYACTVDSCDPAANSGNGACINVADDAACDNGVFCDGLERCIAGSGCVDGQALCEPPLICDEQTQGCSGCTDNAQCNDGNACTDGICEDSICSSAINYDLMSACCDPVSGNLVPIFDGDFCTVDTCDESTGTVEHETNPDLCADGIACRYVRVRPTGSSGVPVAIAVKQSNAEGNCVSSYVQADGSLGGTPFLQTPEVWGNIDVTGNIIVPYRLYEVTIDDGNTLSDVAFARTFRFGDVDGNGNVNLADVQQVVLVFQQLAPYTNAADIKPCLPNGLINFEDIFAAVQGFQGVSFFDSCADPCK